MGVLSNIFKPRDKSENRTASRAYTFYMVAQLPARQRERSAKDIDNLQYVGSGSNGHWELNE